MLPALTAEACQAAAISNEPEAKRLVPLLDHLAVWKQCIKCIRMGPRWLQNSVITAFNRVLFTKIGPEQALGMEQEVKTLFSKEAIESVPHELASAF